MHKITGVVINPDTDRPLGGVTIVLTESRHPFLRFPFMTNYDQPVAHTNSGFDGRFSFSACLTESYHIVWDAGGSYPQSDGYQESEFSDKSERQVTARLFALPSLEHERKLTAELIEQEDASLAKSCL
jgi:hypothetical protein